MPETNAQLDAADAALASVADTGDATPAIPAYADPVDPYGDATPMLTRPAPSTAPAASTNRSAAAPDSGSPGQPEAQRDPGPIGDAAPDGSEENELPEGLTAEQAYKQYRYMQSERDKSRAALVDAQRTLEESAAMTPVVRAIMTDPALLGLVSEYLTGAQAPGQAASGQKAAQAAPSGALARPQPPVMPADPYGDEWAEYLTAHAKYTQDLDAYLDQRTEQRLAQVEEKLTQKSREAEAVVEQQRLRSEARKQAEYELGIPAEHSEQFVEAVVSGALFSDPRALAAAFMATVQKRPTTDAIREQQSRAAAEARKQQRLPTTATAQNGQASTQSRGSLFAESESALDPWS
jgi:hypothetical protein